MPNPIYQDRYVVEKPNTAEKPKPSINPLRRSQGEENLAALLAMRNNPNTVIAQAVIVNQPSGENERVR